MSVSWVPGCRAAGEWVLSWPGRIVCSRWGAGATRTLGATFAWWAAVIGTGLALNLDCFWSHEPPPKNDRHAMICLELAIHRQRFGCLSHIDRKNWSSGVFTWPTGDACIFTLLPDIPEILGQRLLDLPERLNPSTEDYVRHLEPFVKNENSVMLVDRALLGILPDLTLEGMIRAHRLLKVACLALFVFFLLRTGFSPLPSLGAFEVALLLLREMHRTHPVSLHPFLLPVTLLLLALLGLCLSSGVHRRIMVQAPALTALGVLGAFLVNLRSSYLPVAVALALAYVVVAAVDLRRHARASFVRIGLVTGVALVSFAAGYQAFTAALIAPIVRAAHDEEYGTYAHHVAAHPLVLFLAVPPNELARREGIEFDDHCGLKLARRIEPSVRYLGTNYDKALLVYYFKLWLFNPGEMVQLYHAKFRAAAETTARALPVAGRTGQRVCWALNTPLRLVADWRAYLVVFACLALVPLALTGPLGSARTFALSALAGVATLLFVEQAMLPSNFLLNYNAIVCFWFGFVGMVVYQAVVDGIAQAARRVSPPAVRSGTGASRRPVRGRGTAVGAASESTIPCGSGTPCTRG